MFEANYLCNIAVNCRTCDEIGTLTNVGSLHVTRLVRKHRDCDVSIDVTDIRHKRKPRYANWRSA